uniref:Uncharacterized protein n=1 Tax=Moniliophthora roreri TaxID=221103 RepID=A0A0W0F794_MONRR
MNSHAGQKRKRNRQLIATNDLLVQRETASTSTGSGCIVIGTITTREVEQQKQALEPQALPPPPLPLQQQQQPGNDTTSTTAYNSIDLDSGVAQDGVGIQETEKEQAKAKCYEDSDAPLLSWMKDYHKDWLYSLILSIDANFKQKAHTRANDYCDPALGPGWGVFVHQEEYMNEVKKHTSQDEVHFIIAILAI